MMLSPCATSADIGEFGVKIFWTLVPDGTLNESQTSSCEYEETRKVGGKTRTDNI